MSKYPRANPAKWWRSRGVGAVHRSPAAMFISPLRRFTTVGLLVVLVSLIVGVWYVTNPQRISRLAQILLSNVLGGDVEVGSGRLSFAGTLELTGVKVRTAPGSAAAGSEPGTPELFSADQVTVRFDWFSLLSGELKATQIIASRPTLNLVEDLTNASWNYQGLKAHAPAPQTAGKPVISELPVILLREARVRWAEVHDGQSTITGTTVVDGQFNPAGTSRLYNYVIEPRVDGAGAGDGDAATMPASAPATQPAENLASVRGTLDTDSMRFTAAVADLPLNESLRRGMPRIVREWCQAHHLEGSLKFLQLTVDPDSGMTVDVELNRVALRQQLRELQPAASEDVLIAVDNVGGTLKFSMQGSKVTFNLHGQVLGYGFSAEGYTGLDPSAPMEMAFVLADARIGDEYPKIFDAFDPTRQLVARLRPRGLLDLGVTLRRQAAGGQVIVKGDVDCKDVAARFVHFPYPLEHINGRVHFESDFISFDHLSAQADENAVSINGSVGIANGNHSVDITVAGKDVFLDERTAACLPQNFLPIWNVFSPRGRIAFACHVTHGRERETPQVISVDVRPLDAEARYSDFPYPLHHIKGHMVIGDQRTEIENLTCAGELGGEVVFSGTVDYPHGDLAQVRPNVKLTARGLPLDRAMLTALPPQHHVWTQLVDLAGKADFDGVIGRAASTVDVTGALTLHDATLAARDQSWAIAHLQAAATVGRDQIEITRFEGQTGVDGACHMSLTASAQETPAGMTLTTSGRWEGLTLVPNASALLPPEMAAVWNEARPAGVMDGSFEARLAPAKGAGGKSSSGDEDNGITQWLRDYRVDMNARGVGLSPRGFSGGIGDIAGHITVTAGTIGLKDMTLTAGPAWVSFAGEYDRSTQGLELRNIRCVSAGVPETWTAKASGNVTQLIGTLHPQGTVMVDVPLLHMDLRSEHFGWDATGRLMIEHMHTGGAQDTQAQEISLAGMAAWRDGGFDMDAALAAQTLNVTGHEIEAFTASVTAGAKEKRIRVSEMRGQVAGGVVQGEIQVFPDPPARYEATLVLNGAELAPLVLPGDATEEQRLRVGTGKVSANLSVQEKFGDQATRSGRGDMAIRDGTIYDVPLTMGLLQLATLRLPMSRAFNTAKVSYYIRDNQVTFEKILLESPGMNLAGTGTLSLADRKINLRFLTQSSEAVWLSVIDWARGQLVQVQVTGPVDSPQITPVALDAVSATLKMFLPALKPAEGK